MPAGYVKPKLLFNRNAAASYPLKSLGGSTQLQCLPYRPTWNSNTASTPLGRTLLTAAKFSLGKLYGKSSSFATITGKLGYSR